MGKTVGSFVAEFIANTEGLSAGFNKAADLSEKFTGSITAGVLKADAITKALEVGFHAIAGAMSSATTKAADYGDMLVNASERTGLAVETLGALKYAADASDTSFEALSKGVGTMSKNMDSNSDAFARLGVQVKNTDGTLRPVNEVMGDVSEKFKGLTDGALKASLAQEIYGKSGVELIPFLNSGRDGLQQMTERAQDLGLVMSDQAAHAGKAFNDSLTDLSGATTGLSNTIGEALLPPLTVMVEAVTNVVISVGHWVRANKPLIDSLVDLGQNIIVVLVDFVARGIESISDLIGVAATVAYALGMDGLSGKLETVSKAAGSMALGLYNANNKMADAFYATDKLDVATKHLTTTVTDHTEEIKKAADAQDKLNKKIEDASEFWKRAERESAAAMAKNFEMTLALGEFRMRREEANKALERTAQINELGVQSTNLFLASIQDLTAAMKPLTAEFDAELGVQAAIQKSIDESNRAMGISVDLVAELTGQRREDIIAIREHAGELEKAGGVAQKYEQIWQQATASVTAGFVKSFSDTIFHAKNFGEAMKGVAMSTAESMFQAFLTGLLNPLTSRLSDLGRKLADVISGTKSVAGSVAGAAGAAGSQGAAGLLGSLGGWAGVAGLGIAAGTAGYELWKDSQAHWEANSWVERQNQFDSAMASLDSFLYTHPLEAAEYLSNQHSLVDSYISQLTSFARGGKDERQVARQALATFDQMYGSPLRFGVNVPAFEYGTAYVPRTGPAIVHEGERITPAEENDQLVPLLQRMCALLERGLTMDGERVSMAVSAHLNRLGRDGSILEPGYGR